MVLSLSGRSLKPSWYLMTCCFSAIPLDGFVLFLSFIDSSITLYLVSFFRHSSMKLVAILSLVIYS